MGCSGSLGAAPQLAARNDGQGPGASSSSKPKAVGDTIGSALDGQPSPGPLYTPGPRFSVGLGALTPSSDDSCSVGSVASDVDGIPMARVVSGDEYHSELSNHGPPMVKVLSNSSWASTSCTSEPDAPCLPPGLEAVKPERIAKMEKCFSAPERNAFSPDPDDVLLSMAAADERASDRSAILGASSRGGLAGGGLGDGRARRVTFSTKPPEVFILDDRFMTRKTASKEVASRRRIEKELLDPELQGLLALGRSLKVVDSTDAEGCGAEGATDVLPSSAEAEVGPASPDSLEQRAQGSFPYAPV